jgi:hypothetical protein
MSVWLQRDLISHFVTASPEEKRQSCSFSTKVERGDRAAVGEVPFANGR